MSTDDGSSSPEKADRNSLSPLNREESLLDLFDLSGDNDSPFFPVISPYTVGDSDDRTPPRVQGSNSLYGEDLINSNRHSSSLPSRRAQGPSVQSNDWRSHNNTESIERELLISPSIRSTQSEATTPPSDAPALSLSPPLLNKNHSEARSYASSRDRKSRPPRAPVLNLKFAGGPGTMNWPNVATSRHVRTGSNGEVSLMSALTESSFEAPFQGSIGMDQNLLDPITSLDDIGFLANLQQPILNDNMEVKGSRTDLEDGSSFLQNLKMNRPEMPLSPCLTPIPLTNQLFNREPVSFTLFIKQLEDLVINDDEQSSKTIIAFIYEHSISWFWGLSHRLDRNKVELGGRRKGCLAGVVGIYMSQSASIAQKVNEVSKGSGSTLSIRGRNKSSNRRTDSGVQYPETRESRTRRPGSNLSKISTHGHSSIGGMNCGEQPLSTGVDQYQYRNTYHLLMIHVEGFLGTLGATGWHIPTFFALIALASGSLSLSSFVFVTTLCISLIMTKHWIFHKVVMMSFFHRHYWSLLTVFHRMGLLCELVSIALDGDMGPALTPTTVSRSIDSGLDPRGSGATRFNSVEKNVGRSGKYPECPSEAEPSGYSPTYSATTEDILAFRCALNELRSEFPFSAGFGLVDSRQSCLEASNAMFERLQSRQGPNYDLIFVKEIIAALSSNNGTKDEFKKEELRNLLHPDKRGKLSRLDFVTSVDRVYVDLIILRANLRECALLLHLLDRMLTVSSITGFVAGSLCICGKSSVSISVLLSGVMVATAILIASFGRSTFDGILFALINRPFNIGDRIILEKDAATSGNITPCNEWLVENIGPFQTKARHCTRGNVVTMANAVLSASHIGCRGLSSQIPVSMKIYFPLDVGVEKLGAFRNTLQEFVDSRHHDWTRLQSHRETCIDASSDLVEYSIDLVFRESWIQSQSMKDKISALSQFCRNLQNQLGTNTPLMHRFPNTGAFTSEIQQLDAIQSVSLHFTVDFPGEPTISRWETARRPTLGILLNFNNNDQE